MEHCLQICCHCAREGSHQTSATLTRIAHQSLDCLNSHRRDPLATKSLNRLQESPSTLSVDRHIAPPVRNLTIITASRTGLRSGNTSENLHLEIKRWGASGRPHTRCFSCALPARRPPDRWMCLRALNLQRPFLYSNRRSPDYDDASSP